MKRLVNTTIMSFALICTFAMAVSEPCTAKDKGDWEQTYQLQNDEGEAITLKHEPKKVTLSVGTMKLSSSTFISIISSFNTVKITNLSVYVDSTQDEFEEAIEKSNLSVIQCIALVPNVQ